jgi:hypothetical protein
MKKLLFLLLAFSGCSKEDDTLLFDKLGVSVWGKNQFHFDRHYSLVDTITTSTSLPELTIRYDDGNNVDVSWTHNGATVDGVLSIPTWEEHLAKWVVASHPNIDENLGYKGGDVVSATIEFKNGAKVIRETIVGENKTVSDIFGITFSMKKTEIKKITDFKEIAPGVGVCEIGYRVRRYFIFNENNLSEVGELMIVAGGDGFSLFETWDGAGNNYLGSRLRYLEFNQESSFIASGFHENPFYEWENDRVIFKLQERNDLFFPLIFPGSEPSPNSTTLLVTISYRKK